MIPKFFQHIGPKVSSALTIRYKSTKNSRVASASIIPSDKLRAEKLKLPSFKHTFASVLTKTEEDNDDKLYSRQSLPEGDYVMLHGETTTSSTRELIQMPAAKLATKRDDLEAGNGMF